MGGAAAQRRSLAVLGLLGASSDRGMSLDKIQAYLWPEVELDKAAHRLAQILYALRRELGVADLFIGSCDLRLNPARIACDVREFETFRQAGDLERAVELYAGPFLDGFFQTDAPEFEHWVENERTGIAQQLFEALETLAAAGSRAEALERARSYQQLLERELEAAPNPAVVALAEQLRRAPTASPPGRSASVPAPMSIGVLPLAQLTPLSGHDHFVEGLTEELRSTLARIPGVKVAARFSVHALRDAGLDAGEIARRLRLHAVLEGSVRQAGPRVRVNVRLISAADGCHLWSARYERTVADMFAAQDELTGVIVADLRDLLPTLRRVRPSPGSNPDA